MGRARAKGTRWEVELLGFFHAHGLVGAERAPMRGSADRGDFVGVPWLHEAKNVNVPRFLDWARTCRRKAADWTIIWSGDRRRPDGQPLVVMPLDLYGRLLDAYVGRPDTLPS